MSRFVAGVIVFVVAAGIVAVKPVRAQDRPTPLFEEIRAAPGRSAARPRPRPPSVRARAVRVDLNLIRDATFIEADRREIALRRGSHNRLGFAYQVAFVRVLGRFPQQAPLEIDGEILRFAALQTWGPTPRRSTPMPAGSRRSPSISSASVEHLKARLSDAFDRFLEGCR